MKHEIECYFEPDIAWLGEINRQVLRLERGVSGLPARQTHLNCSLRPGGDRPAAVTLTLDVGDRRLRSFAEDPSPVRATRRAFDKLRRSLDERVGGCLARADLYDTPLAAGDFYSAAKAGDSDAGELELNA